MLNHPIIRSICNHKKQSGVYHSTLFKFQTMNRKRIILAILIGGVVFTACKKEETTPNNSNPSNPGGGSTSTFTPSASHLASFQKDNLNNSRQSFVINIDNPVQITGNQGTRIQFTSSSLVDAQGNTVTGNVEISLVEVLNEADMILMNKPTVGLNNGIRQTLVTGGEILLDVQQNGQNLFLDQGASVQIEVPTENPDSNMEIFAAGPDSDETIWESLDTASINVTQDTTGNNSYYNFFCDSLRWINCDYFWDYNGALTEIIMNLPDGLNFGNTRNFILIKNQDLVVGVYSATSNNMPFIGDGYRMPVGFDVHFISIGVDSEDNLYANIQTNQLTQDHEEPINAFVAMTKEELKQAIQALD